MTSLYDGVVVAGLRAGIVIIENNHAILRFQLAFMGVMSPQQGAVTTILFFLIAFRRAVLSANS